jgi:hypothetical protein
MRRRTVGFFWAVEQAEEILARNRGALDEAGWYRWAVIEDVSAGLYPSGCNHRWWEYDRQSDKWQKLEQCPAPIAEYLQLNRVSNHWCEIG